MSKHRDTGFCCKCGKPVSTGILFSRMRGVVKCVDINGKLYCFECVGEKGKEQIKKGVEDEI